MAVTSVKELVAHSPSAVVTVPPVDANALAAAWKEDPDLRKSVGWVHSFSTGVDYLEPLFRAERALRGSGGSDTVFTNGKGAFSSSLAEYAMHAMLHFNKKTEQCQENKGASRWNKFVMPVLRGKTCGFLGFGDIAKATAPLATAFGMRNIALRARRPIKGSADDEAVSETLISSSEEEVARFYGEADFVGGSPSLSLSLSLSLFLCVSLLSPHRFRY